MTSEAMSRLHPMSVGQILDRAFSLYRQNFALFAGIVAVLQIPLAIINGLIAATAPQPVTTGANSLSNIPNFSGSIGASAGSSLLGLIFGAVITGALAQAISARYLGRDITIGGAYASVGAGTVVFLIAASILYGIIVGIGFILLVIPGIYLIVRFLFVPEAIVLERTGILGAFGRSSELVKGSWWRVFGIGLLVFIITAVLSAVLGSVAGALFVSGHRVAGEVASAIVGILVEPFQFGALILLYYDLRIRKEGFDIEHLMRSFDTV